MSFAFSRSFPKSPVLQKLVICLLLVISLTACRTGWSSFDRLMQNDPYPQIQTARPMPATEPVSRSAGQPVSKPVLNSASGPQQGYASSRLDSQPWPPNTGQPLPSDQSAFTTNKPTQPPSINQSNYNAAQPIKGGNVKVALLLPLSGKNAALGQAMLNAAQLAVFEMAPANFEIMPRDTSSNAENAARDAMASGAQILIGPLFATEVTAVKPLVQTSNINMLALSTDMSLSEPGVYVMGFAPSAQVERVVSYAASRGLHHFAALVPGTAYGRLVHKAFEESVQKNGGTVVAVENPKQIQALVAKRDQIDALLLPLGGEELKQAVNILAANGFDFKKIRLLGTGLWDESGLGSRIPQLSGGWYAAAEPEARESFVAAYKKTYGVDPPRIATLAYDATALAAVLASRGSKFDRVALTDPSGFAGLDGIFRFTWDGRTERGLAVNEVTAEGIKVIDPSPSTFLNSAGSGR